MKHDDSASSSEAHEWLVAADTLAPHLKSLFARTSYPSTTHIAMFLRNEDPSPLPLLEPIQDTGGDFPYYSRHYIGAVADHLHGMTQHQIDTWAETTQADLAACGLSHAIEDVDRSGLIQLWLPFEPDSYRWADMESWSHDTLRQARSALNALWQTLGVKHSVDSLTPLLLPGPRASGAAYSRFWDSGQWVRGAAAIARLRQVAANSLNLLLSLPPNLDVGRHK